MKLPKILFPTLALFSLSAIGQTPQAALETSILDPVIVTATSLEQDVFDVPYTAHVINRERFLDQRSARTLADALSETPGVMVQRSGYGQASPFIRGFTGFRTLLLIDGIRLNNAVFREGPNQYFSTIDLFTVDRLEVVKGPSSVLHGSDAVGGTVNAITRGPEMLPWPEDAGYRKADTGYRKGEDSPAANYPVAGIRYPESFSFHPGGFYRYATAEESHTVRGEFSMAATPHVGLFGGVTWKDYGDLRGGDLIGDMPETGYSEIDGDVKMVFRPNKDVDITAAFQRVEQNNAPRTHSTIYGKSFDGTALGTDLRRDFDQLRELVYLQAEAREVTPWLSRATFSLSYHNQEEVQDRIRADGRRSVSGFEDQQYGVFAKFESPSPLGTLSYGVEYYRDEVSSHGRSYNADGSLRAIDPRGPVADDASYDLLGVYLQDQFKIGERVEITAGVRYSYAHAEADDVDPIPTDGLILGPLDKAFDAFTASLRARFDVTKEWNFFGGVSQGFRAPNLSDFTSFELARSGEQETPAEDLDEERYVSFEFGTKARIEPLHASLYAAYYYTLIDHQIVRFPTGRTIDGLVEVTRTNGGDGYVQGVEFGAEWNFYRGFHLFGTFNWQEGEVDVFESDVSVRRPLSRVAPLSGMAGLRWESAGGKWWLEGSASLARRQDRLAPGDVLDTQRIPPGGTGGYSVYAVRGGWRPTDYLSFTAAVENVTDEDYRIHGSGLNEPGTNVVLATRLKF